MHEKTELRTKRLVLRPLTAEDLQTVHAYASDLENTKWMQHLPNETIEETLAFLKSAEAEWQKEAPSFYEFAVLWEGRQMGRPMHPDGPAQPGNWDGYFTKTTGAGALRAKRPPPWWNTPSGSGRSAILLRIAMRKTSARTG